MSNLSEGPQTNTVTHAQAAVNKGSSSREQSIFTDGESSIKKSTGGSIKSEHPSENESEPISMRKSNVRDRLPTDSPQKKLSILFEELQQILESDEYNNSLRKYLHESNPDYLKIIEKRNKDLLKEDHGIVIAGETSAGKSTLINKLLQKRIFNARNKESTSTICKIRNSEEIKIITERVNGEIQTIPLQCNIETEKGEKSLRDILNNLTDMTSSKDSKNFRYVDIGFPIPFLKGNTIIVDTPGIGGSGEVSKKVMEYLPYAVSFIFVVNVGSAGGMQKDRLPEILNSIRDLQIENEMPCFDPREVLFITNKWDTLSSGSDDCNDDAERENTWQDLLKDIKEILPDVKEENIFRLNLKDVSSEKANASTREFENFRQSLKKVILRNENIRLSEHLRFLHEFLKQMLIGIDSGLALSKRSEEEQWALADKHYSKIKELKRKCVEEEREIQENLRKIIKDKALDVYDYMSTEHGKNRILNPPEQFRIMDIPYSPYLLNVLVQERVELYVNGVFQSKEFTKEFLLLKQRALDFYTEISSKITEMENDWIEALDQNAEKRAIAPYVAGVIAAPLWIPLVAVVIGLGITLFGVGIAVTPITAPVILILGRKERRQKIIDEEYEKNRLTIQPTICKHLDSTFGTVYQTFIEKITNKILQRKMRSLEKMIQGLFENRQRILENQVLLQSLSRKIKIIQKRKQEIQLG